MDTGYPDPDHKTSELHSGEVEETRDHSPPPRYNNPRHLNTTVANQAFTFNGTTPHASVSYTPGTFNMRAPFSTQQQVPYKYQPNQLHTQNQQYRNNSFVKKQNNTTSQSDATALVEKLQKLILTHKNSPVMG